MRSLGTLFAQIEQYLDQHYTFRRDKKYKGFFGRMRASVDAREAEELDEQLSREHEWKPDFHASDPLTFKRYYREYLERHKVDNFSTKVMRKIAEKGLDSVEVYKKARIDRRLFSKIRSSPDYLPSKRTVFALAIGLELTLEETEALMQEAGYHISDSILFDLIMKFFLSEGNYNIDEINAVLAHYDREPFL